MLDIRVVLPTKRHEFRKGTLIFLKALTHLGILHIAVGVSNTYTTAERADLIIALYRKLGNVDIRLFAIPLFMDRLAHCVQLLLRHLDSVRMDSG